MAQIEALNALQVASVKNGFPISTKPGDILYFNNVKVFHGREPYAENTAVDTDPHGMDRHVLRLWLQDPQRTTTLSPSLQKVWDEIYGPNTHHGREECWLTEPVAAYALNAEKNG
jgi:hypothetical protein